VMVSAGDVMAGFSAACSLKQTYRNFHKK